jgi:hypothetical protein
MSTKKLISNKAQCRNCNEIIESTHRHHFNVCKCYSESHKAIDDYLDTRPDLDAKNIYKDSKFKEMYEGLHGIAVDGGLEYTRRLFFSLGDIIELSEYEEED